MNAYLPSDNKRIQTQIANKQKEEEGKNGNEKTIQYT